MQNIHGDDKPEEYGIANNSFEAQVDYYTRLIEEKVGWICAGIYADQARSGTKTSGRDQFQRMLQDCRLGNVHLWHAKEDDGV